MGLGDLVVTIVGWTLAAGCVDSVGGLEPQSEPQPAADAGGKMDAPTCSLYRPAVGDDAIVMGGADGCVGYGTIFSPIQKMAVVDICNRCPESRFIRLHGQQVGLRDRNAANFTSADFFTLRWSPFYGVGLANAGSDHLFVSLCRLEGLCEGPLDQNFELPPGSALTLLTLLPYDTPPRHPFDDRFDRPEGDLAYDARPIDYRAPLEVRAAVPRLSAAPVVGDRSASAVAGLCVKAGLVDAEACALSDAAGLEEELVFFSKGEDEFPMWLKAVVLERRESP